MISIFKKKTDQQKKAKELTKFAMKVNGYELRVFESFQKMSKFREIGIRQAWSEMELGIRATDLDVYMDMVDEAINEGNLSMVGALNNTLRGYRNQYISERITLNLAGWGIIVDDEPYNEPRKKDMEIKQKLLNNREVHAFFLTTALGYLTDLSNQLDTSKIEAYMKSREAQIREATFLKLTQQGRYENLWSRLIPK